MLLAAGVKRCGELDRFWATRLRVWGLSLCSANQPQALAGQGVTDPNATKGT